jgi:OmcA/MtrC family decaheme c-type cytochrome
VGGPTFNYQRVIAEQSDVATASTQNSDGSYTYRFPVAIPGTYLAPLNDTASFGPDDGELSGEALLAGTYTVGLYFGWDYTVEGSTSTRRDVGNTTFDFLFGSATVLAPREVVKVDNCNQCHSELQAHGGLRRDPTLCLLCHTAGAEDRNTPGVAGGTPGVSIDFKVMIHKIHAGEHLPSVLGIGTNPDGSRDYAKTPQPYLVMGFGNNLIDFSHVVFPLWPSLNFPMPRDTGHSALAAGEQAQENSQRAGPVACFTCHGDPDDDGPLTAPAQGDIAYQQPSRNACSACHDDIDWALPYESNMSIMPFQATDSACTLCHGESGSALAVRDAHLHPMLDPDFNPGLNLELASVDEAGANDGDGTIDTGEKVALTFTLQDDLGADVAAAGIGFNAVFGGPTQNMNVLASVTIPSGALTGAQPFTVNVPMNVFVEPAGTSTGALEDFTTAFTPHWDPLGAATTVWARTATAGGDTTLASAAPARRNYVDVVSAAGFARNDYLVLDDGMGNEEYLRIQHVEGERLWFGSTQATNYPPGLTQSHAQGATVREVTLTPKTAGVDYALDAATGTITELVEFGDTNRVVVSYTTDFVMPASYPLALNDSPDLGQEVGEWTGLSIVDGTYLLTLWASRTITLNLVGESNSYRNSAPAVAAEVLVGSATTVEPWDRIASAEACYACHQDIYFHGGSRRGVDACIACHGTSGAEDRPQYVAANAPPTTGLEIRFREMIHKIHMGAELANASSYEVVGFGSAAHPNNFGVSTYEEIEFPAFPSGAMDCAKCHGAGNSAWTSPNSGFHPSEGSVPSQPWTQACGACHDSDAAQAHIASQTSPSGAEACAVCHEEDSELAIDVVHKIR